MDPQPASNFTSPLEHRLRQRIDQLIDERDHLRARVRRLDVLKRRYYERSKSAALWKHRALRKAA